MTTQYRAFRRILGVYCAAALCRDRGRTMARTGIDRAKVIHTQSTFYPLCLHGSPCGSVKSDRHGKFIGSRRLPDGGFPGGSGNLGSLIMQRTHAHTYIRACEERNRPTRHTYTRTRKEAYAHDEPMLHMRIQKGMRRQQIRT